MASSAPALGAFPSPFSIETPPGCEGWEEMYPYYALFDEHRRETDENRFWFWNSMHFPVPMPAFDVICIDSPYQAVGSWQNRVFAVPPGDGHRLPDRQRLRLHLRQPGHRPREDRRARRVLPEAGRLLLRELDRAVRQVADEDGGADRRARRAAGARAARVRARRGGVRRRAQHGVLRGPRRLRPRAAAVRPDVAAPLRVPAARLRRLRHVRRSSARGNLPDIPDQHIAQMVAGIDVLLFKPDAELRRLARLAIDTGVDAAFVEGRSPAEIDAELAQSEAGRSWLDELEKVKDPWFNMATGDGLYHYYRSWLDDPSIPYAALIGHIGALQGGRGDRASDRGDPARARPPRRGVRRAARRRVARSVQRPAGALAHRRSPTSRSTSSSATTGS